MYVILKKTGKNIFTWAVLNPKKVFTYSMIILTLTFLITMAQGIFFPSETAFKIKPPILYSKKSITQNSFEKNEKEMKKIIDELKSLKLKRDQHNLEKKDSLRIDYLYNQYQQLKNGK